MQQVGSPCVGSPYDEVYCSLLPVHLWRSSHNYLGCGARGERSTGTAAAALLAAFHTRKSGPWSGQCGIVRKR